MTLTDAAAAHESEILGRLETVERELSDLRAQLSRRPADPLADWLDPAGFVRHYGDRLWGGASSDAARKARLYRLLSLAGSNGLSRRGAVERYYTAGGKPRYRIHARRFCAWWEAR